MRASTRTSRSLTHDEWDALAGRQAEEQRLLQREREQRDKESKQRREEEARQRYEDWVAKKSYFEKARELLARCDKGRALDDEWWFEAAVALAAVDRYLGIDADAGIRLKTAGHSKTAAVQQTLCASPVSASGATTFARLMRPARRRIPSRDLPRLVSRARACLPDGGHRTGDRAQPAVA